MRARQQMCELTATATPDRQAARPIPRRKATPNHRPRSARHHPTALAFLCSLLSAAPTQAQPPQPAITLPEILAVEMPEGAATLRPDEPPLRDLIARAKSDTRRVTTDLPEKIGPGPTAVTWTAWDTNGKPTATRSAVIYVLPHGMTPIGTSGDDNATAGNNARRIVRDPDGNVHMIWSDSGGPSGRTGPTYRRVHPMADGTVTLDTPPIMVAEGGPSEWNAYPSLTLSGNAVQLVWQGGGTARTRLVSPGATGPVLGPVIDTTAPSAGRDVGPAMVAQSGRLHLVTPAGIYAASDDNGAHWHHEPVPRPSGVAVKTMSLAADASGAIDIAFSAPVISPPAIGKDDKGSGGWWQFRTIHHAASGEWSNPLDVLQATPGWMKPEAGRDALADWVAIAAAPSGGLHATWHGTAISGVFGHDQAYYAWRDPSGSWQPPIAIMPPNAAQGIKYSFAPSLTVDNDRALVVVFYDVYAGAKWIGFDADVVILRNGRIEGPHLPLTHFVQDAIAAGHPERALSSRFPSAAPTLSRTTDGRVWLDVLETLAPGFPGATGQLIVYQRLDVTAALLR